MTVWDMMLPPLLIGSVVLLLFPAGRSILGGLAVGIAVLIGLRSKGPWDA